MENLRTAEIAAQYGGELKMARRLTEPEKQKYADWYREYGLVGVGQDGIKVHPQAIRQVITGRKSDGQFAGCDNSAWIITSEEWDAILAADVIIKDKIAAQTKKNEAEDYRRKKASGYCPKCHSYCYGDCEA